MNTIEELELRTAEGGYAVLDVNREVAAPVWHDGQWMTYGEIVDLLNGKETVVYRVTGKPLPEVESCDE